MNVPPDEATLMVSILGTNISTFPQTYIGLPFSLHKLLALAFLPLYSRCDSYLSGWCANLLNKGGRLSLLASVLDSLPTYFMSSFLLPAQCIEKFNKNRRSFCWDADDTCSGAQCLIAWDKVRSPKIVGGLDVKKLEIQNVYLLMKFRYKFLHSDELPWK